MSAGVLTESRMAKQRKNDDKKKVAQGGESLTGGRIEFQAPEEWIARLDAAAAALGMSRSAYIRMACNRQMNADERN